VRQVAGEFDLINCVGVLHLCQIQSRDSISGDKIAPGELNAFFVYGELGRWEIKLMQQAIALLQNQRVMPRQRSNWGVRPAEKKKTTGWCSGNGRATVQKTTGIDAFC